MSVALMTLFAVSILGALGMAVYGLGVLLGRWEQPRRFRRRRNQAHLPQRLAPPVQVPAPQRPPLQSIQHLQRRPQTPTRPVPPAAPAVWVLPTGPVPPPMAASPGMATPLPAVPDPDLRNIAGGSAVRRSPAWPAAATAVAPLPLTPASSGVRAVPPTPASSGIRSVPPTPASSGVRAVPPAVPVFPQPVPAVVPQTSGLESPGRLARGSIPPDHLTEHLAEADAELIEEDTDPGIPDLVKSEKIVQSGPRFSVIRSSRR